MISRGDDVMFCTDTPKRKRWQPGKAWGKSNACIWIVELNGDPDRWVSVPIENVMRKVEYDLVKVLTEIKT